MEAAEGVEEHSCELGGHKLKKRERIVYLCKYVV